MTTTQYIEIKGCLHKYNAMEIIVCHKEPSKIGLGTQDNKPTCFPYSHDSLNRVDLIVTRGENYRLLNFFEIIAKINLECPEIRCLLHKDHPKSTLHP